MSELLVELFLLRLVSTLEDELVSLEMDKGCTLCSSSSGSDSSSVMLSVSTGGFK